MIRHTGGDCRRLICSLMFHPPLITNIQVASDTKTCAAALCFSLRRTIQLPGIPAQTADTERERERGSRPPGTNCCANTHHVKKRNSLCLLITWTHVWHDHIWSLQQPPPPRTPRPSIQQHPAALTFKDACTEAVKDEDQVLVDNHILLFSFTISRRHSTFVSVSSLSSSGWTYPGGLNGAVSDWPELHWWTLPFFFLPEKSLCISRRSGGQWLL